VCPSCGHVLKFDPKARVVNDNEVFINLTPHPIRFEFPSGVRAIVKPSGMIARVKMVEEPAEPIALIVPTITRTPEMVVKNLPAQSWQMKIVSSMVLEHCTGRDDVVAPDTGATAIRGENGLVEAVTRFVRPK